MGPQVQRRSRGSSSNGAPGLAARCRSVGCCHMFGLLARLLRPGLFGMLSAARSALPDFLKPYRAAYEHTNPAAPMYKTARAAYVAAVGTYSASAGPTDGSCMGGFMK